MTDRDELTPEEALALEGLAGGENPPAALEDRTVARLRNAGLLGARDLRWRNGLLAAAAGLALFAAGVYVGQRPGTGASGKPEMQRFALLLYDAPDEPRLTESQMEQRVEEYRNWARGVRRAGGEITGEKLEPREELLGPPIAGPGARGLGGYFVIAARDEAAAVVLARSCPHLQHGGSIQVRPIAKT